MLIKHGFYGKFRTADYFIEYIGCFHERYFVLEINNQNTILSNSNSGIYKNKKTNNNTGNTPAFKGGVDSFLNKSGWLMHKIESGGFLVLFLIQDFLGMNLPRTIAGFLRDKEVTGEYNIQEGLEVFGRESLTGPSMMAVAPLCLWLASKPFGQSTSVNTELIKRYGNSLKEMVSAPDFNRELLKDSAKFKEEFIKRNVDIILKETLGNKPKEEIESSAEYIIKQLKNYENIPADAKLEKFMGKSRYRSERMNEIIDRINSIKYSNSDDLNMLQRVKFGIYGEKDVKTFDTKKAFDGLLKYTNDVIKFNKNLDKLDGTVAESFKHNTLGKRVLMNISMIAATLGMLSVLPKLYLRSNTAPGARKNIKQQENINNENIAFKGKNSKFIEKIGKVVEKNKRDFVSSELEYNGHNFTNSLMAGLSLFGLITPRCMRAYSRAQVDEHTGKKDMTELWEIIIRDITSSLAVVFAVPMMTRALVTSYEKNSGFVLMQKDRTKNGFKTTIDLFNPYSKAHVLSNSEITALYDTINSKEKMVNFCKYIDKNGGDLQKILSKSESAKEVFNEKTIKLEEAAKLSKEEANKKIISFMENIEKQAEKLGVSTDKKSVNDLITKLMKSASKGGNSKITAFARGLNSVPGLLTTIFISPYILGWFIPRLTYRNTRRIHAKEDRERKKKKKMQNMKA